MTGAILLERFKAHHFRDFEGEPSLAPLRVHITPAALAALEAAPYTYSFMKDGKAIACAGATEYWPGRAEAWAILSDSARKHGIVITRMFGRLLRSAPIRRIEAAVECDFAAGHRLVRALKFECEASRLRAYTPDGKDCTLYARVGG